jgi:hypothetical protein
MVILVPFITIFSIALGIFGGLIGMNSLVSATLMTEAASSKMTISAYETTQCYNPEHHTV